jgi:hypothetical protein
MGDKENLIGTLGPQMNVVVLEKLHGFNQGATRLDFCKFLTQTIVAFEGSVRWEQISHDNLPVEVALHERVDDASGEPRTRPNNKQAHWNWDIIYEDHTHRTVRS